MELALYRIAQEELSNIRKHDCVSHAQFILRGRDVSVRLGIGDDGREFTPPPSLAEIAQACHYGLLGMQEWGSSCGEGVSTDDWLR